MMETETYLNKRPSKTFYQGDIGDEGFERAVHITYFDDCIELEQQANGCVLISRQYFEKLVKSIRKDLQNTTNSDQP